MRPPGHYNPLPRFGLQNPYFKVTGRYLHDGMHTEVGIMTAKPPEGLTNWMPGPIGRGETWIDRGDGKGAVRTA